MKGVIIIVVVAIIVLVVVVVVVGVVLGPGRTHPWAVWGSLGMLSAFWV